MCASVLIHVQIQVNLSAQVKVEEGVNAEHKEKDGCDDQESIPESRGILLGFSFQSCCLQDRLCLFVVLLPDLLSVLIDW